MNAPELRKERSNLAGLDRPENPTCAMINDAEINQTCHADKYANRIVK